MLYLQIRMHICTQFILPVAAVALGTIWCSHWYKGKILVR